MPHSKARQPALGETTMVRKRRTKTIPKGKQIRKTAKILEQAARPGGVLNDWMAALTRQQSKEFRRTATKVDTDFLLTKVNLIQETLTHILRHKKDALTPLLQRNLWSSFDAIALHFDQVGVTRAIQTAGARIAKSTRLDEPRLVALESDLVSAVFGGEAAMSSVGLARAEVEEVIHYAEKNKLRTCGLSKITRKRASFTDAAAKFCGRPDKMFDVVIHSPQAPKVVIMVVLLIANVIALVVGVLGFLSIVGTVAGIVGLVVAVITAIVIWIVGACGC